jgi:putative transposase
VIFGFIAAEKANHKIATMCRVLGVSRSGFHAWATRRPCARRLQDERLLERIREIHQANRRVYGSPRVHAELVLGEGERVGRKRVERLMRQAGLSGLVARRRGRTTIRVPGVRVCEDLVDRAFLASAPDRLWVADITYLRTWQGWLYLVAVQDVFSRRIVGWAMADHMRTELVLDALQMALARRRPAPGLIWHSDQGSQFVSLAFGQQARAAGIAQSMGSRGDCFDNAVAESFFATLKKELIHRHTWPTKADLRTEVFDYIEVFYNRRRRHRSLGMRCPVEFEEGARRLAALAAAPGSSAASRLVSPTDKINDNQDRAA